ncbi:minor capsid protein [Acetivibrio cellulolyticus]|uniref:minor capsid protein n=1 Tax=Acetivibrio cellulolyticus TaxID=35830 RepID=UPI0001E2C2A0|nr:minor capsid protein [Acetivibrio cellulolyticus]
MSKELEKEILKIHTDMESLANTKSKKLLQAYKRSLDDIRKEIGLIFSKYAVDGVLSVSKQQRINILKGLEKEIIKQSKYLGNIDLDTTTDILKDVYKSSYYQTLFVLDKGIKTTLNFTLLNPKIVEKAVMTEYKDELFSDRIWKNKNLLVNRLKLNIERGIIQGKSVDKLVKDIKNTFGSSAYESKRLINTELARVISDAQTEIYNNSAVVKKVMYVATLDNKTSDICASLDGQIFEANGKYPHPPQHPNCRSCIIPVIDGWSPSVRKDNMTKEEIDYSNYENWLKSREIK